MKLPLDRHEGPHFKKLLAANGWWIAALFAWVVAVMALTLQSGGAQAHHASTVPSWCLICGDGGTADAILNVWLFIPLGLILGHRKRGTTTALLMGLFLSSGIEGLQFLLPGRYPGIGDILWNSIGSGLGVSIYATVRHHVLGAREGARPSLAAAAALAASLTIFVSGVLLSPRPTRDDYWGQWTPHLGSMPRYDGRVLSAELSGIPIPAGRFPGDVDPQEVLSANWAIEGSVLAGSSPRSISPILSIYDGHQREILLIGALRKDAILRERTWAKALRLDQPDLRLESAFARVTPGDTVTIAARREGGTRCISVNDESRCGLGFTAGRTWGLLLYLEGPTENIRRVVDFAWLAALFFPIGLFARSRRDLAGNGLLGLGGVLVATISTRLILGPWYEVVAWAVGIAAGRACLIGLRRLAGGGSAVPRGGASR